MQGKFAMTSEYITIAEFMARYGIKSYQTARQMIDRFGIPFIRTTQSKYGRPRVNARLADELLKCGNFAGRLQ